VFFCIRNLFHVNNWLVRVITHDGSTPINPAIDGKNPIYPPLLLAGEGRGEGGYNGPPSPVSSPHGGEDVNVLSTLRCTGDIFTRV
jgi:hypothetical protein